MKKAIAIFLLIAGILTLTGCQPKTPKEVAKLQYTYGSFSPMPPHSRLVDLQEGKIWIFDPVEDPQTGKYAKRDESAENQGYTLLCELPPEAVAEIQTHCNLEQLLDKYKALASDGIWWRLIITYADGTEQQSSGAMHWPPEFKELSDFLYDLTEFDVLHYYKPKSLD